MLSRGPNPVLWSFNFGSRVQCHRLCSGEVYQRIGAAPAGGVFAESMSRFPSGPGSRHVRNGLDFRHTHYPEISLPLVVSIQRIVIGAEV
jgi:hypothetical protein